MEESCDEQKWDSQRVVQISRGPPPAVNIRFDGVTVHGVRTVRSFISFLKAPFQFLELMLPCSFQIKEKGEDTDLEMQTL